MSVLPALFSRGEALAFVALLVVILFGLALLAALGLVAHHAYTHSRRGRWDRRLATATQLVADALLEPEELEAAIARSTRLTGERVTAAALRSLRSRVGGDLGQQLSALLASAGETARLARQARSRRPWVRRRAARGLGECGGPEAVAPLRRLLSDEDPDVRRTARMALLGCGDEAAIRDAMASYLADAAAARGWRTAFHARVAAVAPGQLRELLASETAPAAEQKLALESLGAARDAATVPLARERLEAPDPEMRAAAARLLGRLRHAASRPDLVRMLGDPVWYVRAVAARALENLGSDPACAAALARALRDPSWWVRANAARALVRQGSCGLAALLAALSGDDAYARDASLVALASPKGVELLSTGSVELPPELAADRTLSELLSRAAADA